MEGEGATNGTPISSNVVMSSADCVSLDAVASEVMGFYHKDILTTRFAHERKLGIGEIKDIRILGPQIGDVKLDFNKSKYVVYKFPDFIRKSLFRFSENVSFVKHI